MPHTFGIGTKFCGKDEIGKTGSYLATKWIVFFYIPILPIGSFKVRPKEKTVHDMSLSAQRNVIERVPLQWWHVCNVYAFIAAMAILTHLLTHRRMALVSLFTGKPPLSTEVSSTPSAPPVAPSVLEDPLPPEPIEPDYKRPTTAENGVPFPESSGYIKGYEQAFTNGKTVLTIDHEKNNYDIYVKLYNLDVQPPALASVFLVKALDNFTIETIMPGTYELRYRNLDTGDLFRTSDFTLEEKVDSNSGALVFTHLTLSLYGVVGGDLETYPIDDKDFEEDVE